MTQRFGRFGLTAALAALLASGCTATQPQPPIVIADPPVATPPVIEKKETKPNWNEPVPGNPQQSMIARSKYFKAEELRKKGATDAAIYEFKRCIDTASSFAPAWFKLSLCYFSKEMYKEEIEALERCVALEPKWAEPHLNLAHAYLSQEDLERALKHYLIVIELQPTHPIAHYDAGLIYFDLREYDKAAEHLRTALRSPDLRPELREKAQHYLNICEEKLRNR